jgi:tetratricopeptide (TPR) repeat protein
VGLAVALSVQLAAAPLEKDPAYVAGEAAFAESKYARARELAEKCLKTNKGHYPALLLLGKVYRYGEGSMPRAYHCYDRAQKLIETTYKEPATTEPVWPLYAMTLEEKAGSAQQLERYAESCQLIDQYDNLFQPKHTAWKGWPLLKLGRMDECRDLMLKLLKGPEHTAFRGHILNNLGNVEFETDNLQQSYGYFKQIADEAMDTGDIDPVFWSNAGEAARDLLRYDEAEKLFLESTKHFSQYTYSDPWGFLAELYAAENRLPEAVEALKSMQAWRLSGSAQVSQNKWASCYAHAGSVLMQMGYDQEALKIMERLIRRQDRNSGISTPASLIEARMFIQYAYALQMAGQRTRERLSFCSWSEVPALCAELVRIERRLRESRARVANLVVAGTGLEGLMQPYGARSLDQPSLSPLFWSFFGAGPTLAAVQTSLQSPKAEMKARRPYLLAIAGEAYHHDFKQAEALQALQEALEQLPSAEVKLRHRCEAIIVRILLQRGQRREALRSLQQLMDKDPSQLRACEIALPLSIESDGGRAANQARSWLWRSPRCARAKDGFTLKLRGDTQVEGELTSRDGTVVGSYRGEPRNTTSQAAGAFCEVFHQQAFAPIIDLSQADIHSIDGSTGVARPDQAKELLE